MKSKTHSTQFLSNKLIRDEAWVKNKAGVELGGFSVYTRCPSLLPELQLGTRKEGMFVKIWSRREVFKLKSFERLNTQCVYASQGNNISLKIHIYCYSYSYKRIMHNTNEMNIIIIIIIIINIH